MSLGNSNNNNNQTSFVDRLNRRLAKLMGKKDTNFSENETVPSNFKFGMILLIMLLFLWLITGVYYIPQGSYGVILKQGKITNVESGLQIGFSYPYPFADLDLIDASENNLSIGESSDTFQVISSDNQRLAIAAEISYKITNPTQFFTNYSQDDTNLDQRVSWLAMAITQDYVLHHQSGTLLHSSTIVTSNEIRNLGNQILKNYGIEFTKFAVTSLITVSKLEDNDQNDTSESGSIAQNLIQQANQYATQKSQETAVINNDFDKLLPQYHANNQAIVELMYYKMLSSIPIESGTKYEYPLLKMNLRQLQELQQTGNNYSLDQEGNDQKLTNDNLRAVNRSVARERIFKDR